MSLELFTDKRDKRRKIMADVKITKRERFEDLKVVAAGAGREDLVEFIDEQIALGGKPKQRAEMAISRGYVPGRS